MWEGEGAPLHYEEGEEEEDIVPRDPHEEISSSWQPPSLTCWPGRLRMEGVFAVAMGKPGENQGRGVSLSFCCFCAVHSSPLSLHVTDSYSPVL